MKTAVLPLLFFIITSGFAQNSDHQTTARRPKISSKHAVSVDIYPFLHSTKIPEGTREYIGEELYYKPIFKLWNLSYEYTLGKNDDKIKNKLKIGLLGFYNKKEDKQFSATRPFPYFDGYFIQRSALGFSVGLIREQFFSDVLGFYGGADAVYSVHTTIYNSWISGRQSLVYSEGTVDYLFHDNYKYITYKFSITPQIGFLFRLFDRIIGRVGLLFDLSYSYLNEQTKFFYEFLDGSIYSASDSRFDIRWYPVYRYPKRLTLNIYPQITLNYAF